MNDEKQGQKPLVNTKLKTNCDQNSKLNFEFLMLLFLKQYCKKNLRAIMCALGTKTARLYNGMKVVLDFFSESM